jgi:hypothetical protein
MEDTFRIGLAITLGYGDIHYRVFHKNPLNL